MNPTTDIYDLAIFRELRAAEPYRSLPYQEGTDGVSLHISQVGDLDEGTRQQLRDLYPESGDYTYCVHATYLRDPEAMSTVVCSDVDDPEAMSRVVQEVMTGFFAVYRDRLTLAKSAAEWCRGNLPTDRGDSGQEHGGIDANFYYYHTGREYSDLQESIVAKDFNINDDSPFGSTGLRRTGGTLLLVPSALVEGPKEIVYLTPAEIELQTMAFDKLRREFSDVDNDVFDILADLFVRRGAPGARCESSVTDILSALGVNKRGGHYAKKREEVNRSLARLQTLWLRVPRMQNGARKIVESRALIITDRAGSLRVFGGIEMEEFRFQMGDVFTDYLFGPGRQTIRVSRKALQYHETKEKHEKRLTRTLAPWVRIEKEEAKSVTVRTLLDRIHMHRDGSPPPKNPGRVRTRFEGALDRIQEDDIVRWEYHGEIPADTGRGWFDHWLEARITFYFPSYQLEDVRRIKSPRQTQRQEKARRKQQEATAAEVKAAMRRQGIDSKREAARQIGISPKTLDRFLGNEVTANSKTRQRVREWLDRVS